jgi:Tol biopolymer transport system component
MIRRMLALGGVAALLLPLAVSPVLGFGKNKIAYQRFDWHIYRAPHFDVYYYPEEENLLDDMVSYAESQYVRLSQILDHEIKFRIPLIYYRTHVEFEQTNVILEFIPEAVGAFAEPIENRMVIPADLPPDKLYELVGHELTHIFEYSLLYQESLSRAFRSNVPGWLMEGLASHLAEDEDNIDRMVLRDAVVSGFIPPITRLQVLNFLTYRYGHAVFDFIVERWGTEGLRNFLWEFRKSLLANNIQKPIQDAFGVDGNEFDRQFRKYLQAKYLPVLIDNKEPEDYGRELGKDPKQFETEHYTFGPALSPSGELIAVMTTRWRDLDIAILSAKDGKVIRNLTEGFTNKYEYPVLGAFQGKKDLTWSPDGDKVAFFARREDERVLMIYHALRGDLLQAVSIPDVDDEHSPAWGPDGRTVAFEGYQNGQVDIFLHDLDSGKTTNLTQDDSYDHNPAWSPDGAQILYNRRINDTVKVFLVEVADPSRKVQLTFGEGLDLQPSFARDARSIHYTSDTTAGIFNLHSLDLETGDIRRLTNVIGGVFSPLELPAKEGERSLVFTSYSQGLFRLYRMNEKEPEAIQRPAEQTREPADPIPFQPPLRLTLDDASKSRYEKLKFHIESAPSVLVGVADDGTVLSNAQIMLADLLGDHRLLFNFQSVSTFSNFFFGYYNLKNRWQWSAFATDYRDFFLSAGTGDRVQQASSFTGGGAEISYPINRYYRIGTSASYWQRTTTRPFQDFSVPGGVAYVEFEESYPLLGWDFNGDTTRFKSFGPYHGKRFQLSQQWAPTVSASACCGVSNTSGPFVETALDFRAYGAATSRSLFALRLLGLVSHGDGYRVYSIGGLNQLRGYEYREFYGNNVGLMNVEFRFPLVDALAFPIGVIRDIRGFFFLDVGTAWLPGDTFYHSWYGAQLTDPSTSFFVNEPRSFDFWDSKNNKLGDGRVSYGFGWNFYLGPFQLTWTFARNMENTLEVYDPVNGRFRIDDPTRPTGSVSSFYIARDF